jgi:hypothetical protein
VDIKKNFKLKTQNCKRRNLFLGTTCNVTKTGSVFSGFKSLKSLKNFEQTVRFNTENYDKPAM